MTSQAVANYANNLSGLRQNLVEAGSAGTSLDNDKKQFESSILNQSSFLAKAKATEGLAQWAKQTDTVRAISTKLGRKVGKSRAELRQAADDAKQALQEETDSTGTLEGLETANAAKQAQLASTQGEVAANVTDQAEKATEATSRADAATEAGRVADESEQAAATAAEGAASEAADGAATGVATMGEDALAAGARVAATAARSTANAAASASESAAAESAAAAAKGTQLAAQAAEHTTQATTASDALAAGKAADEAAEVGEAAAKAGRIEKLATGLKDTEEVADAADAAAPDPLAIFVTAVAAIGLGLIGRKVGTHTIVAPTVAKAISYSATAGS